RRTCWVNSLKIWTTSRKLNCSHITNSVHINGKLLV
ncbi:pyruvate formate-lyase 1-activating enzyme, partial [Vibrio parahaemolyticus V-223/04]